jgi:transposase
MNGTVDLSAFADDTPNETIEDLAQWVALEDRVLELMKKEHSERKAKLDDTKEKLAQMLKAKGLKSMKLDSGLSPCRATATKFYTKAEADIKPEILFNCGTITEALCRWFEKNGLGDNVKRSVNFQTMNSVFKERQEAGEPIPTDLVDLSERDTLRMNNKSAYLAGQNVQFKATQVSLQGGKVVVT